MLLVVITLEVTWGPWRQEAKVHLPPIKNGLDCWINSHSFQQECVGNRVNNKHTDIRVKVVSELLYLDSHGTTAIWWWYVFWISKRFVSCQKKKLSVSKMYVRGIYFFSLFKKKIFLKALVTFGYVPYGQFHRWVNKWTIWATNQNTPGHLIWNLLKEWCYVCAQLCLLCFFIVRIMTKKRK